MKGRIIRREKFNELGGHDIRIIIGGNVEITKKLDRSGVRVTAIQELTTLRKKE